MADPDKIALQAPRLARTARLWTPAGTAVVQREVACEIPVALEYNCISHAVMMITPRDIEDFAYGFSLTEGVIDGPRDILDLKLNKSPAGLVAALEITPRCFARLNRIRRQMSGRSGCGLCGIERLEYITRPLPPLSSPIKISPAVIHAAMRHLDAHQPLNRQTGAVHAAAFCDRDGQILAAREDVGRHNALDKLIGHMLRQNMNPAAGFALITSRCSFEMVQKAACFGIPVLAAISAPTALALSLAEETGLTVLTLVRKDSMDIHTDSGRRLL
ncbi:formate dehydrogenase accessory sulfurtransferase FdhD [Luteithermobacter gelatinilyticus]|uniref:formate dehydrogenase accessory sulfurtransferase FdhD n=1 Tax=Luteithermobacter gelatinilyticus TaxID=2582913 RepID=UPI0011066947|nr:formate dehydrogenase accessory sulfurtransferase FdhD [Luteithermobacter gelatinilyticus]